MQRGSLQELQEKYPADEVFVIAAQQDATSAADLNEWAAPYDIDMVRTVPDSYQMQEDYTRMKYYPTAALIDLTTMKVLVSRCKDSYSSYEECIDAYLW